MCGISGVLAGARRLGAGELAEVADAMAQAIAHRGPDGSGLWVDTEGLAGFGHRRLAVYDLSEAGAQPMTSGDGRWTIAFNGAIYNHVSLRRQLEGRGHRFRGSSDTEVLVNAIAEWGLPTALPRLNGMFAFGAWDAERRTLFLARDRLGEKPLYYGWAGGSFLFASGLRSFEAVPWFRAEVDRKALGMYFRRGYVPAPHSIYAGVHKLAPGQWAQVDGQHVECREYWSAAAVADAARKDRLDVPVEEATARAAEVLSDAVGLRLAADVPVGSFLSGGIDSSVVTALMQAQALEQVRTFTARFEDASLDESVHARAVAAHLGTDHTELRLTDEDCRRLVPRLAAIYDEPLADISQVPTHLIAAEARSEVTVAMSGDGGDELFGGYNRYRWAPRIASTPRPLRRAGARMLAAIGPGTVESVARVIGNALPRANVRDPAGKAVKLADALRADDVAGLYRVLTSQWAAPPLADWQDHHDAAEGPWLETATTAEKLMLLDAGAYLPGDVLAKVDGATMAVALEARVPLLDHNVFEFAWRLPPALRKNRCLLRRVLYRHVPASLVDRPKAGFDPPMGAWLRGSLRPWAEELLAPGELAANGLDEGPVRAAWSEHVNGAADRTYELWAVVMFQAWASR